MLIRQAGPDDLAALQSCFFASVSVLAAPHYTPEQRRAWVERGLADGAAWRNKLAHNHVWHALEADVVAGFCSLTHEAWSIGCLCILHLRAKAWRGPCCSKLKPWRATKLERMEAFASLAAQPVFTACGYTLEGRQQVDINGIKLENAHMLRVLE